MMLDMIGAHKPTVSSTCSVNGHHVEMRTISCFAQKSLSSSLSGFFRFKGLKECYRPTCNRFKNIPSCSKQSLDALPEQLVNDTELSDLLKYFLAGPLVESCGISSEEATKNIEEVYLLGRKLSKQLLFDPENLSEVEKLRVYHYYIPVYFWCLKQVESKSKPVVIGISAPQGCGKTTVVESLEYLFNSTGRKAASVSIDDFYLTYEQQSKLAQDNPENKLLELRGNAGSHDLDLGVKTLQSLKKLTSTSTSLKLPRYNKSAYSGRGDRADFNSWPTVEGPLDVVLFEGWMLGFEPVTSEEAKAVDPQLEEVNKRLESYSAWHDFVDSWIVVEVDDPTWVYNWRLQAEIQMRNKGKPGMTDEEVSDFVSRYIPAYKAYLPGLYNNVPEGSQQGDVLKFRITESRSPLG